MPKFYPAGGGGAAGWDDVGDIPSDGMPVIVVSGAGTTAANGNYQQSGVSNSRPIYTLIGGESGDIIAWDGGGWSINGQDGENMLYYYLSSDDVATPDLVTTWVVEDGESPIPTVTTGTENYTEYYYLNADGSGGAKWTNISKYRVYTAILNHDGTALGEISVNILENTLGFTPEWFFYDDGEGTEVVYYFESLDITDTNAFVIVNSPALFDGTPQHYIAGAGSGGASIVAYDAAMANLVSGLENVRIEIRLYWV